MKTHFPGARIVLALLFAGAAPASMISQGLPLFDAHIHYGRQAWETYPVDEVIRLFDRAGIRRALVSSTPDEGTWRLYEAAPDRVVPMLRLYHDSGSSSNWHRDTSLIGYMEKELASRPYRGIGEVHLDAGDEDAPVVRRALELASRRGLIVQVHTGEAGMAAMLKRYPGARFLWAHAGLGAPAASVRRLVERSPDLRVELSLRYDVATDGRLDPEWRKLFLDFPDRFLVGTDTWIVPRWESVVETAGFNRRWLGQLPPEVSEQIAWRNAERLFPSGAR